MVVTLALIAAGCGGAKKTAEAPAPAPAEANPPAAEQGDTGTAMTASGPACAQLPQGDAAGGLQAMAVQPAGTAASTNPLLTKLVSAVQQAGLADTLNGEGPFTIFAPVDAAFAKIPEADLNAVLADKGVLTKTLTYHVHSGDALTSDKLATMSTLKMANESDVALAPSGDTLGLNGQAKVVCANIKVGNGFVHLIDTVLTPSA
ncbi:MAG: fasciclin domain-containing protein [Candidatus Rokuibacteriota bacterium]